MIAQNRQNSPENMPSGAMPPFARKNRAPAICNGFAMAMRKGLNL